MSQKKPVMIANHPIEMLQEKVQELQTALFSSLGTEVLKMPSHVVTESVMDDQGQLWFTIPRPMQYLSEFETNFPAKLDFFKKGKPFFLKLEGKASIVTGLDDLSSFFDLDQSVEPRVTANECIVIKVQIDAVQYSAPPTNNTKLSFPAIRLPFYNWLIDKMERRQPVLVPIPLPVSGRYRKSYK